MCVGKLELCILCHKRCCILLHIFQSNVIEHERCTTCSYIKRLHPYHLLLLCAFHTNQPSSAYYSLTYSLLPWQLSQFRPNKQCTILYLGRTNITDRTKRKHILTSISGKIVCRVLDIFTDIRCICTKSKQRVC